MSSSNKHKEVQRATSTYKLQFIQQYLQKSINIQDFENITNINKDVNSRSIKLMLNIVIFDFMEDHLIVIMHARLCHP